MHVLQDGAREGRFSADAGGMPGEAPDGAKASSDGDDNCPCANRSNCVTAISFDKNQRRLVMGTNSGAVTVWNFNNGSLLRRCAPSRARSNARQCRAATQIRVSVFLHHLTTLVFLKSLQDLHPSVSCCWSKTGTLTCVLPRGAGAASVWVLAAAALAVCNCEVRRAVRGLLVAVGPAHPQVQP